MEKIFKENESPLTPYCQLKIDKKFINTKDYDNTAGIWTRSPYDSTLYTFPNFVTMYINRGSFGYESANTPLGIVPAMWIKTKSIKKSEK